MSFMDRIKKRPVRFNALVHAVFGAIVLAGLLTEAWVGAIILIVNSFLAFWLENYTTPVDSEGVPRNSLNYRKI